MTDHIDRILAQTADDDARFRYEIIKGLADSIRQQTKQLSDMQHQMHEISERLVRIEANRLSEEVSSLRVEVDLLKADRQRREGAMSVGTSLLKSPVIAWAILALATVVGFIMREQKL